MRAQIVQTPRRNHAALRARLGFAPALLCALSLSVSLSLPASAKRPEVRIVAESDLRFGSFMVFGTGSRSVSSSGIVSDVAIVALEGSQTGPARFTVSYDRGNNSKHVLDIELELVMSTPPLTRESGVVARVDGFDTDLPGTTRIIPGQAVRISLSNCRTRLCSRSFQIGGRIDVNRQYGGADLTIPLPVDVAVISVERQR